MYSAESRKTTDIQLFFNLQAQQFYMIQINVHET